MLSDEERKYLAEVDTNPARHSAALKNDVLILRRIIDRLATSAEPPLLVQDAEVEDIRNRLNIANTHLEASERSHFSHANSVEILKHANRLLQIVDDLRKLRASSSPATNASTREKMIAVAKQAREQIHALGKSFQEQGAGEEAQEIFDNETARIIADSFIASGLLAGGQWRPIDWMDIQTRITNFVRIEDDSEEWEGPNNHITGKKEATDAIAKLITDHGGKVVGP